MKNFVFFSVLLISNAGCNSVLYVDDEANNDFETITDTEHNTDTETGQATDTGTIHDTETTDTETADTETVPDTDTKTDHETDDDTENDTTPSGPCSDSSILPRQADVIIAVDTSAQMETEISMVNEALGAFWSSLSAAGTNPYITLFADSDPPTKPKSLRGICIVAPLGSGDCPQDSNLPEYKHIPQPINKSDALSVIHSTYDQWKTRVRAGGDIHFIVVSSSDSAISAESFINQLNLLDPPISSFVFHSITAASNCEAAKEIGEVYNELAKTTGGVSRDLCLQTFAPDFGIIADGIAEYSCRMPPVQ